MLIAARLSSMPSPPLPLCIEFEFLRATNADDAYAFKPGLQSYLLRSAGGTYEQAIFDWLPEFLDDLATVRQMPRKPVVLQRIGEKLRRFLAPLGWSEHEHAIRDATPTGQRVFLTVRSAAAELYALPWELLTLKDGRHVGELANVLIRYEVLDTFTTREGLLPRPGCGRILFAWSGSGGNVPAAAHQSAIAAACRDGFVPFEPTDDILSQVSLASLDEKLKQARKTGRPIAVLHILCHGRKIDQNFGLVFDDSSPTGSAIVDPGDLRRILGPFADMVRLVVLMACDSGDPGTIGNELGSVAQALHAAGIEAVIASRFPLSIAGSTELSEVLYTNLLVKLTSVESALLAARQQLATHPDSLDWGSVQLYARRADDGALGPDTRPLSFRPYPGLAPFTTAAARHFFGRGTLTQKLAVRLRELHTAPGPSAQLLAVVGPSGCGKTSVTQAGLLPELARNPIPGPAPMMVRVVRPGEQPRQALNAALASLGEKLVAPALLVIDPLEELYTHCGDVRERDDFVALLLERARDPGRRWLFVLNLRSDCLSEVQAEHPELGRVIVDQSVLVSAMSRDELCQAITGPAAQLGHQIDAAIVNLLVEQTHGNEGTVPLLALTLSQIWEGLLAGREPADTLEQQGGIGGALVATAHQLFESLSTEERTIAKRALVRLVNLGEGTRDTRRRAPFSQLQGIRHPPAQERALLRRLASDKARLLTLSAVPRTGSETEPLAEVTHEALFDEGTELRAWLDAGRENRRYHDRLTKAVEEWQAERKSAEKLYRGGDLDRLTAYAKEMPDELTPEQHHFWQSSLRARLLERMLRWGAFVALLFVIAGATLAYIVLERRANQALHQQLLASYEENGRALLFLEQPFQAARWLHRAYSEGRREPSLRYLLAESLRPVEATELVLAGHTGSIEHVEYSRDGSRIITAGADGVALIFSSASGQRLVTLRGHKSGLTSATFNPDGTLAATASSDGTAAVWDAMSGVLRQPLDCASSVRAVSFSSDGSQLLAVTGNGPAFICAPDSGLRLFSLSHERSGVTHAAFSPDGRQVLTAGADGTTRIWDARSGRFLKTLPEDSVLPILKYASWNADGRQILTVRSNGASSTMVVWAWDGTQPRRMHELPPSDKEIAYAAFSHAAAQLRLISIGTNDQKAQVWDVESERRLYSIEAGWTPVNAAAISPDDRYIVSAAGVNSTLVSDARHGQPLMQLTGHTGPVRHAAFSPDGVHLVTVSADGTGRVWDLRKRQRLASLVLPPAAVGVEAHKEISLCANGEHVLYSGGALAAVFDLNGNRSLPPLAGYPTRASFTTCSADGSRALAISPAGVSTWSAGDGTGPRPLPGPSGDIVYAAYSPDGQLLATAEQGGAVRLFDVASSRELRRLIGHTRPVRHLVFSRDRRRLLSTSPEDGTARLWDVLSGTERATLAGPGRQITRAAMSPDGAWFVTCDGDGTAGLHSLSDGTLRFTLRGHAGRVTDASFSPDSSRLVTVGIDGTARVFLIATGNLITTLLARSAVDGAESPVQASFDPQGQRIATLDSAGTLLIWDAQSGRLLRILSTPQNEAAPIDLFLHVDSATQLHFSGDGNTLTSIGPRGTLYRWDIRSETRSAKELSRRLDCLVPYRFRGDALEPSPTHVEGCLEPR